MNKGAIYSCVELSGGGSIYDQGEFEVIQLTDKICKLKHIKKGYFNSCDRFYGRDKEKKYTDIITIKSIGNMKDFIGEEFTHYDKGSGTPFIFTLNIGKTHT